jgi:hypothetical protein
MAPQIRHSRPPTASPADPGRRLQTAGTCAPVITTCCPAVDRSHEWDICLCRAGRSGRPPPRLGHQAPALPSEEFEGFVGELCVELEDAAVPGIGVDHQLTIGQAAGQVG